MLSSSRRALLAAAVSLLLVRPAIAQTSSRPGDDLLRARLKMGAYLDLLKATEPFAGGWTRYLSTVALEKGPTGKEIRIGGLSAPRDVTREIAAAQRATKQSPAWPDCDAAIAAILKDHDEAARVVSEAAAYHTRNAHREDEGRVAREHHLALRAVVPPLLEARAALRQSLEPIRAALEIAELAAYEKTGGRDGKWHIRRSTVESRRVLAVLPEKPGPVDMAALDAALVAYEAVVVETEAFGVAKPDALMGFGSAPRQFLTGMRALESKIRAISVGPIALPPHLEDARLRYEGLAEFADAFLRPAA